VEHYVEPVPGWARCPGENEIAPRVGNVFRALDSGTVRVDIRAAEGSLLFVDSCIIGHVTSDTDILSAQYVTSDTDILSAQFVT